MVCVWESLKREHNILPLAGDCEMHLFSLQRGSSPDCRQALRKPPHAAPALRRLNHSVPVPLGARVPLEPNANQAGIISPFFYLKDKH